MLAAAAPSVAAGQATALPAAPQGRVAPAPSRIVSLAPAITEILFALGLGSRVVGVSTYCDYPAEAARLPKVGTFSEPVAEAIVALAPDLVLTSPSPGNETAVRAIQRTGVKVAVVRSEGGLGEALAAISEVASAVGAADEGARLLASIDARLAAVRAKATGLARPRVAVVIGREPLVLAGPASYLGELVTLAGGSNIADPMGGRWPRVGVEFLVASRPEVLVDLASAMSEDGASAGKAADGGTGVRTGAASAWSDLRGVPAVDSGRVVTDRDSLMLRPGPRLADAAEALFAALHPSGAASGVAGPASGLVAPAAAGSARPSSASAEREEAR